MSPNLADIFSEAYRELRPRTPAPAMHTRFYPFVSINNTIRMRQGDLYIRLSDLLEGAPDNVLYAIAHILLAKLYRKPVDRTAERPLPPLHRRPRSHRQSPPRPPDARTQAHPLPSRTPLPPRRNFRRPQPPLLPRTPRPPQLTWSQNHARRSLGHYDPAHNAIVISRVFDDPRVPRYAVEYILYHEMLHLKHPVKLRGSRRCVHSKEFVAEENLFPEVGPGEEVFEDYLIAERHTRPQ